MTLPNARECIRDHDKEHASIFRAGQLDAVRKMMKAIYRHEGIPIIAILQSIEQELAK